MVLHSKGCASVHGNDFIDAVAEDKATVHDTNLRFVYGGIGAVEVTGQCG